jgi:nucleotide-binding universal stress UspA family protein
VTFKTILVHVDDGPRSALRLGVALGFAAQFRAHLVGMYVVPTRELAPSVAALLPADMVAAHLQEMGAAQHRAEAQFRQAAGAAGCTAIEWRAPAGSPIDAAVAHARCSDLTILGQGNPADPASFFEKELTEAVVLTTGRPTLIVPFAMATTTPGQNVLVAWDGGREASRAVGDALPVLANARHVTVMALQEDKVEPVADAAALARLAAYLGTHGINAKVVRWEVADVSLGEWLLSRAADLGVDLIVMGAYAHTRLRELVLGGVTRTMLTAMTVPVLMSH